MKVVGAILFFLPILVSGQEGRLVSNASVNTQYYLNAYSQAEGGQSISIGEIESFISALKAKRPDYVNDKAFLHRVFMKTHKHFLRHYHENASFGNMIRNKSYNCLTGTALFSVILEELGYSYQAIETNYHIFLLVKTAQGSILIETTDAINGFVTDSDKITARIENYKHQLPVEASGSKTYYRFKTELYSSINLSGILGLLYYNQAVQAYNRHDLPAAINQLDKAIRLYRSPRMEEFSRIIQLTIYESKLAPSVKASFLQKIEAIRTARMPAVASAQN